MAVYVGMQSEYLCDTEVNLCYSNPCRANGTCVQREGGYLCICPQGVTGTIHRAKLISGATSRCACVQKRSTECWWWWAKWDLWCAIRVITILVCSLYRFHSVFSPWIICDNDYFPQYVPHTVIFDFCLINLFFFPRDHFRLVHIPQGLIEQEAQLMLTYTRDARCAFHVK